MHPLDCCRAALQAPWSNSVVFDSTTRIPQQLWQTSTSNSLSDRASKLQDSWRSRNPGLNITLMNDTEAAGFISSFYGPEVAALYAAYPLGVMRADFWRYAILYAYGGVYSDIDTKCLQPLAQWLPPKARTSGASRAPPFVSENSTWRSAGDLQYDTLTWDDCSMVVALENDVHMCQWTFAAVPGHPVLRSTLQVAVKSLEQGVKCEYDHMVHVHTGPGTWTEGLRDALGLNSSYSSADIARAAWTDPVVYQRAREMRLCVMAPEFFGGFKDFEPQNVKNHYSSQWKDEDVPNTQWIVEKAKLDESLKSADAAAGTATD
jgi:mannosyltransferase OCH1-like enzyme